MRGSRLYLVRGDVTFAEVLRYQCLDRCRDKSPRLLSEQSASLMIGIPYHTLLIYRENRIR
jgi:hypothetical protein